jgi:hypothetical protein
VLETATLQAPERRGIRCCSRRTPRLSARRPWPPQLGLRRPPQRLQVGDIPSLLPNFIAMVDIRAGCKKSETIGGSPSASACAGSSRWRHPHSRHRCDRGDPAGSALKKRASLIEPASHHDGRCRRVQRGAKYPAVARCMEDPAAASVLVTTGGGGSPRRAVSCAPRIRPGSHVQGDERIAVSSPNDRWRFIDRHPRSLPKEHVTKVTVHDLWSIDLQI